jgi:hypothetical protein
MAVLRPRAIAPLKAFVPIVGVLGLLSLALIYGKQLNGPPIRSDGMGYYLYLPAAVIDHDLTLQRTVARSFGGQPPEWAGVNRVPNSKRLLIKYPPGEAILLAPFFLVAHVATLASASGAADGFSTNYQAAAAIAGLCYLLLGLSVLQRLLRRSYSPLVVWWTLVVMVFGTNLFHYGTYDAVFSHAYSFCLFALFLGAVERWYARPAAAATLALAVVAALITLVRPTNSVVFVFALLFGIIDGDTLRGRGRVLRAHGRLAAGGVLVYAAALSPLFFYWKHVTQRWIIFSYTGEGFDFAHPQLTNVLFSVRKGLFFWSPALLVATVGLLLMKRYKREYLVPALVFVALNLYVVASWRDWAYGGSFGHRAFVESTAVLAFGYAAVLERAFALGHRRLAVIVSCAFAALSTRLMIAYWLGALPFDRTTWQQFAAALRW